MLAMTARVGKAIRAVVVGPSRSGMIGSRIAPAAGAAIVIVGDWFCAAIVLHFTKSLSLSLSLHPCRMSRFDWFASYAPTLIPYCYLGSVIGLILVSQWSAGNLNVQL